MSRMWSSDVEHSGITSSALIEKLHGLYRTPKSEIFSAIEEERFIQYPPRLGIPPVDSPTANHYCHFHGGYGHLIDKCKAFKKELNRLVDEGYLDEILDKLGKQEIRITNDRVEVETIEDKIPDWKSRAISFGSEDIVKIENPYQNSLVIAPIIGKARVYRVLVSTERSVSIITMEALSRMCIDEVQYTIRHSLQKSEFDEFEGEDAMLHGCISLPLTLGTPPTYRTIMTEFVILSIPRFEYNAVLGRNALIAFAAIFSLAHQVLKFPTEFWYWIDEESWSFTCSGRPQSQRETEIRQCMVIRMNEHLTDISSSNELQQLTDERTRTTWRAEDRLCGR